MVSAGRIMFGDVGLELDTVNGHCTLHVSRRGPVGPVPHSFRLHSQDEIDGALSVWSKKPGPYAKNMIAALRHAGQALGGRS